MKKNLLLCVAALASIAIFAQIKPIDHYPPVQLKGTQLIKFNSGINHHDYELYIDLPGSYKDSINKHYPVLYILDGQWFFPQTIAIREGLRYEGYIPEMIVVGIGWPDNYHLNRNRDFLPPSIKDSSWGGGGAPKFLDVVKNEIMKFTDSAYRTDKQNNALQGESGGGNFALYALFHAPELFNKYIISCPSLMYDDGAFYKDEKAFSANHHTLNARIFMTSSEYEVEQDPSEQYDKFVEQFKASNYTGLQFESIIVEKMGHATQNAYALGRGLQFVFHKPDIKVDSVLLEQYTGHYEQGATFRRIGDSLYVILGSKKILIHAETNDIFYTIGNGGTIEFIKDKKGKVSGVNFKTSNGNFSFKKLD